MCLLMYISMVCLYWYFETNGWVWLFVSLLCHMFATVDYQKLRRRVDQLEELARKQDEVIRTCYNFCKNAADVFTKISNIVSGAKK